MRNNFKTLQDFTADEEKDLNIIFNQYIAKNIVFERDK